MSRAGASRAAAPCGRCSISARRWNTAWSSRTASAPPSKRRTTPRCRAMPPAATCGSVQRERAATKYRRGGHERRLALERRAVHVPTVLRIVERRGAVLRAAVVPEHRVARAPLVPVDEFRAHREFLQVADELGAFGGGESLHLAGPAPDIERRPARLRVLARDRMPDIGSLALVFLGERRQVRIVHVMQPHAAEAGAPA